MPDTDFAPLEKDETVLTHANMNKQNREVRLPCTVLLVHCIQLYAGKSATLI